MLKGICQGTDPSGGTGGDAVGMRLPTAVAIVPETDERAGLGAGVAVVQEFRIAERETGSQVFRDFGSPVGNGDKERIGISRATTER
ncbi:MAG: hypothetical protein METHP_01986 [Methanoregula sp. SKADARSKE-2]|nr:MAG: hypothetical protein METHP_01986 [Methanoregula sp. SKADARSKE-2]